MTASRGIDRLLDIMARLRDPENGCPWDLEQDFATIAPYTIEEAYEVAEAIEKGDMAGLRDELGDLLFQVVFHGRMAEEQGQFDFDAVAHACADKMERRHPHVFGDARIGDAAAQTASWEAIKAAERAEKGLQVAGKPVSALDGVTAALPALTRAVKIQRRAARVGFDWGSALPVLDKIAEEAEELRDEIAHNAPLDRIDEELGDLLFALTNLARKLDLDPEGSLRRATLKFERRFRAIEDRLHAQGLTAASQDLATLDALWDAVKADEKAGS
jgi:nucleoside triphosphate diphosphatase